MVKKLSLLALLAVAVAALGLGLWYESVPLRFEKGEAGPPVLTLNNEMTPQTIEPYCQDGVWYYFLPGYLEDNTVLLPLSLSGELQVDGEKVTLVWQWTGEQEYTFTWQDRDYTVQFLTTSQLPTLFIQTQSGSLEDIHASKDNQETGTLLALDAGGQVEYQGNLKRIKGRGNSTFSDYEKKPYAIKLEESVSLAGLDQAKNYTLLALAFDGDKIHSKLGLDLASALGENATQAQWVNLYVNGEWRGLYLIATAVSHLDQFNEEGAILIEKDMEGRYLESGLGFMTAQGNHFSVKRPQEMETQELEQLARQVGAVEQSIVSGQADPTLLDLRSFAVQALTEEIGRNFDAYKTSSFYYYLPGENLLRAGPMWDYDGAFGEFTRLGVEWNDPAGILLENTPEKFLEEGRLTWMPYLYQNENFRQTMVQVFAQAMGRLQTMVREDIPNYAALIQDSVACDQIRWPASQGLAHEGKYQEWENNVRYLEYFLGQRLNQLCQAWNVAAPEIQFQGNGTLHTVTFQWEGEPVATLQVEDGALIDREQTQGFYPEGYFLVTQFGGMFTLDMPILEDCTLEILLDPPAA